MINENSPIGIFDSGLGGISVLKTCLEVLPEEHFIYFGDSANSPYGTKPKEEVVNRCIEICDDFIDKGVKAIVIACNTATSVAVQTLRDRYSIPIIGMEPALKVAANGKENQNIVVMATPLTLKEKKFAKLMHQYDSYNQIIKMPCPDFVSIVENDGSNIQQAVNNQIDQYKNELDDKHIDSVVLGCTHFVFLKNEIQTYFGPSTVLIDGNLGTANHLKHLLNQDNLLAKQNKKVDIFNSDESKLPLSNRLLTSE
ncbi:glutamate racemase [Breznakia pachnodae]|uniref:Glutamate racemase n=1 Tax=Breznakia pachnodae TaxID=265178 RepID=A0ABU0E1Y3_9FIRM|nr:glutamate racemase [Breznakia pachnodae]MDQ0360726.1 glutamate racemase [Breznakia pachnodae]